MKDAVSLWARALRFDYYISTAFVLAALGVAQLSTWVYVTITAIRIAGVLGRFAVLKVNSGSTER